MAVFNEDTRVKIPATIQFMRLGYNYQSIKDMNPHPGTKIDIGRFHAALERLNGKTYSAEETLAVIEDIHSMLKNNDMGKEFYHWLINPQGRPRLIDFSDIGNNDFAVVDELW